MNRVRNFWHALGALGILALGILACGGQSSNAQSERFAFWTETPNATQTPLVVLVEITNSPEPSQTPALVIVTQTPNALGTLCVSALVAVHLRPSPSTENYPVAPLPNGSRVVDLGGRDGKWWFVQVGDKQGWVDSGYVSGCGD